MGLITEEVEVTLSSMNIDYYEKLGYSIPRYYNKDSCTWRVKRNTKINVKIQDIRPKSHVSVELKCDCCGKKYKSTYSNYTIHNHDGKTYCADCSRTILNSGKNSACWKDNITMEEREAGRDYLEYKNFIKRVLARDDYTCICCNQKGGKMIVHHLDGYNWCIDGRTKDSNAVTLCESCHLNFHSIYGYGNNTKSQFENWFGSAVELLEEYNGVLPTTRKVYCLEDDTIYDSVEQASKMNKSSDSQISKCCNKDGYKNHKTHSVKSVNGKHYFWLDEFEKMTQKDLDDYLEWTNCISYNRPSGKDHPFSKSVICTTTDKIFDSLTEACRFYNICGTSLISKCCKGERNTCGKLSDGTKLKWMYYEDYLASTTS